MEASLLVELLTEELPPKSLKTLGTVFGEEVLKGLERRKLRASGESALRIFATPRRLGALITGVLDKAADREQEVSGPSVKAGRDAAGKPTAALLGFARKVGIAVEALEERDSPKGGVFVARLQVSGVALDAAIGEILTEAIRKLPIPKVMRWGDCDAEFVRPVHGLVILHGKRVVPGSVLGVDSGNRTHGHRFLSDGEIVLAGADDYERRLRDEGCVIVEFAARRAEIERQLAAAAERQNARLGEYETLLDEVAGLVEYPAVYMGQFDSAYLEVPQECLILTMRQNQKYFPLFDPTGRLLPRFLIVSNMRIADPRNIIAGNERVVRPRFEDARFFYQQDRKVRLESRVPELSRVVYHNQLGSQLERVERIQLLTGKVAREIGADPVLAERAAWLSKADLLSGMVGEFPELQGVMGRYYAQADGEPQAVADAIEAHYRPRFAGDRLPEGKVAAALAVAEKLDTLAGLFGIGQQPTGDKDPFGLRRAALGMLRILVEQALPVSLHELTDAAFAVYNGRIADRRADLKMFLYERFAGYLKDRGYSALEVDAVLSLEPARLDLVPRQLEAVRTFLTLPEAESLAAANKRVVNILKQARLKGVSFSGTETRHLKEPAERALYEALEAAGGKAETLYARGDFTGYLKSFAVLKSPVDAFFDSVMVMTDEPDLRRNRLALLADLQRRMNQVADISKLAA